MSDYAGVVRNAAGLRTALSVLADIEGQAGADHVLANMAMAARFIATGALEREESRGAHERSDYPAPRAACATRTFLRLRDAEAATRGAAPVAIGWRRHAGVA
jgi:L-aspartate oxidase